MPALPKLIHMSSFPPARCGVAEYAFTLANHIEQQSTFPGALYIHLDANCLETIDAGDRITINPGNPAAIKDASRFVNRFDQRIVLLQHEFKLYGGTDGANILDLFQFIKAPVVTTLHTVWPSFPSPRNQIFTTVIQRSRAVIVFSKRAAQILLENYNLPSNQVKIIPHGVPEIPFCEPRDIECLDLPMRDVKFISLGLFRPTKGIELALAAFAEVKKAFQDFVYILCGTDHPRNNDSVEYRKQLKSLVANYGLENHVFFLNQFLNLSDLVRIIQSCDGGIVTYTAREQSSSGVLALLLSCGRPVFATDFQYAAASLNEENGYVIPMGNVQMLTTAIKSFCVDKVRRQRMMESSYKSTRDWIWERVARKHSEVLLEAMLSN
jgi:glycosyltransferase involved in cell wall biosynthesis